MAQQRHRNSILDEEGATSNYSSSSTHAPVKRNIRADNKEAIVNDNTNDMTTDFFRTFTKSSLIIRLWNKLPSHNEEPIMYEKLETELNTSKSALSPLLVKLEDIDLIERKEMPIKPYSKVNRHYFKKNGRIVIIHSC